MARGAAMREQWDVDAVAMRFSEAVDTAHKLPPVKVQGYAASWPSTLRQEWEGFVNEDRPLPRFPPSPQAVDRMLQTMRWVQWLDVDARHLVWMRAKRYAWQHIAKRFACDRTTAWRRWQQALGTIADKLNDGAL